MPKSKPKPKTKLRIRCGVCDYSLATLVERAERGLSRADKMIAGWHIRMEMFAISCGHPHLFHFTLSGAELNRQHLAWFYIKCFPGFIRGWTEREEREDEARLRS